MRIKKCKQCGAIFETTKTGAYLCPTCATASRLASVYRERTCMDCGARFPGYPKSKRCPSCQAEVNRRRDAEIKRSGARRPLGSTDYCRVCGREYIVESGTQRYCKNCAAGASRDSIRAHKREYASAYTAEHKAVKEANRTGNKVCIICGKVFDNGKPSVTCSPKCAKELKRRRENEALVRAGKRKTPPDQRYASGLPKSGIVGVTARRNGKWQAAYRGHYIGVYETIEAAAAALEEYKKEALDK